jgi:hypothetical protein
MQRFATIGRSLLLLISRKSSSIPVLAAIVLAGLALPARAQAIVQDIPIPEGGSERVLYASGPSPRAILVMFAGGNGDVQIADNGAIGRMGGNFLLRTQPLWLAQGFAFVTIGSASSIAGSRHGAGYLGTIARAIDFARGRANVPVWLVGTSQGSIAAANGAAHLPGRVAGVVLSSSVAGRTYSGETVFDSDLGAIAVPALVVANRGDTCPAAAPSYAPAIFAALARAPRKDVIYVDSSAIQSDPCEAMSPHGYLGIEGDVVQRISGWIGR